MKRERGAASLFVVMMATVLLVCAGLVVDGGLAINARMRTADDAEQAARRAADTIDVATLRAGGGIVIDPIKAVDNAAAYLQGRDYSTNEYAIDVRNDGTVRVEVEDTTETLLLGLVGIGQFQLGASAVAEPRTN